MRTSLNIFAAIAVVVVLFIGTLVWLATGMNRRVEKFFVNLLDQLEEI